MSEREVVKPVQYVLPVDLINRIKQEALDEERRTGRACGKSVIVERALRHYYKAQERKERRNTTHE